MNPYLWTLVSAVCLWFGLAWAFVAVMHAKAVIDRGEDIHWIFKLPLYALFAAGIVLDVIWNWTIGSLIFRELPRKITFTSRVKHHLKRSGWRQDRALWWAEELNKFDRGHV